MNTALPATPAQERHRGTGSVLRAGAGTRMASTAMGVAVSVDGASTRRAHAFRPSLSGNGVILSRGYVAGRMPTIGGVPIAPNDGQRQPVLELKHSNANEAGESFVCVEVHPDDQGVLPPESKIEIVERKEPRSIDKELGRLALAVVIWREKRPYTVFQLVCFNVGYERLLPPDGAGAVRHLWP